MWLEKVKIMPQIEWDKISLGSLIAVGAALVPTLLFAITTTYNTTSTLDALKAALEKKDIEHDMRLTQLDSKVASAAQDHDAVVEIRSDLKYIRAKLDLLGK